MMEFMKHAPIRYFEAVRQYYTYKKIFEHHNFDRSSIDEQTAERCNCSRQRTAVPLLWTALKPCDNTSTARKTSLVSLVDITLCIQYSRAIGHKLACHKKAGRVHWK